MHERHTLYRREQSAQWDYRTSKLYVLSLLGPTVAASNPSPSYYVKTNAEQMNAQQKAYAESLFEQNRAMKKRLDTLMQNESNTQQEVERLKKELQSLLNTPASDDATPKPTPGKPEGFSKLNSLPTGFSDPSHIMLFPQSEADYQAFLISQMRPNGEFAGQPNALEHRRLTAFFNSHFLSQKSLALFTPTAP